MWSSAFAKNAGTSISKRRRVHECKNCEMQRMRQQVFERFVLLPKMQGKNIKEVYIEMYNIAKANSHKKLPCSLSMGRDGQDVVISCDTHRNDILRLDSKNEQVWLVVDGQKCIRGIARRFAKMDNTDAPQPLAQPLRHVGKRKAPKQEQCSICGLWFKRLLRHVYMVHTAKGKEQMNIQLAKMIKKNPFYDKGRLPDKPNDAVPPVYNVVKLKKKHDEVQCPKCHKNVRGLAIHNKYAHTEEGRMEVKKKLEKMLRVRRMRRAGL